MKYNKVISFILFLLFIAINVSSPSICAEESIEDTGASVYSLGEDGESILVRGNKNTVGDYGDVIGYEATSSAGTSFIDYRDSVHHAMVVTSASGTTVGYCMQPYMNGPSTNAYVDYNYIENLEHSNIFAGLDELQVNRWRTSYIIAVQYGFGGANANPNYAGVRNKHDGGTFGSYIISEQGKLKVVDGLMIGGKVYEMTEGEALALTQVIVHYVGNRGSDKNITDFIGNTYPASTSAAFKHMKRYADNGGLYFDQLKTLRSVSNLFDAYTPTQVKQTIDWYVYNYNTGQWDSYYGQKLGEENVGVDNKIQIKIHYASKNLCNKLVKNSTAENTVVEHNYDPFVVNRLSTTADYYDYFSVTNTSSIPITVTYNNLEAGKEHISHQLLGNMEYDIDTFSQSAIVTVDALAMLNNSENLELSVSTGIGASAAPCYVADTGRYCARMFSCENIQDCLMIASNMETSVSANASVDYEAAGSMKLRKISSRTDVTDNNPCYDKSGATYNVYAVNSNQDQTGELVGTFLVNSDGIGMVSYSKYNSLDEWNGTDLSKTTLTKLPLGWYMVYETVTPSDGSYLMDTKRYYVNITAEDYKETKVIESDERPTFDPIPFEIVKECSEGENVGSATLEGAQFTVWYYKGYYESYDEIKANNVAPDRKWIFDTRVSKATNNATCIIHKELLLPGSDEPYLDEDGDMALPLGTIVVEETKAPDGYLLEGATYNIVNTIDGTKTSIDGPYVSKIYVDQGTVKLSMGNKVIVEEKPIRGDISIRKIDKYTGKPMAGIPFLITSETTGEKHVIVTDEEGIASTDNTFRPHSENTNNNDEYKEEDTLKPTGVWFSGNNSDGVVDDSKGALPYDTYIIEELPCKANQNYYLYESFKVDVVENNKVLEYGDVLNVHKPEIGTEVFDVIDNDKEIYTGDKVSIIDRVSYKYLEPGKTYALEGTLVVWSTGKQLVVGEKNIKTYVEFTPNGRDGNIDVPFEFVLNLKEGEKLVAFECLYDKETGELVASHQDINSSSQTLSVIEREKPEENTTEISTEVTTEENTTEVTTEEITTETTEASAVKGEVKPPEEEINGDEEPKTGDSVELYGIVSCMLCAVGMIIFLIQFRKKYNRG